MHKIARAFFLAAAAAPLALVAVTSPSASAAVAGAGLVQGAGDIQPGLTAVPQDQHFSFNGTVTGAIVNGGVSTSAPCGATGHDLAGSVEEGAGTVQTLPDCAGAILPTGVFVRVGAVVVAAFADASGGAGAGVFAFQADQLPPATVNTYHLVGVGAAVHA